jgi:hypothetical protein
MILLAFPDNYLSFVILSEGKNLKWWMLTEGL